MPMQATPIPNGQATMDAPDWENFNDHDLLGHAQGMADDVYQRLLLNDADPERPEGAVAYSIVSIPCHSEFDCSIQLRYVGHLMETFSKYGIGVREVGMAGVEGIAVPMIQLVAFTQEGAAQAEREATQAPNH